MAQNYSELRKDNVRDAIYEDVANNLEVLRTSWAGNAFPENPKVGQACYRIDEDNLYFWDGTTWSQKGGGGIDMNTGDKLYNWVGTLAEYKEQDIENQHPEYLCFITDDNVETKQVATLPVGFIAQTVVPIDESLDLQKYANGQLIFADKFPELVNKLKKSPNLLVDEDTWQAEKTLSVFGQCGKFVLDEVAGTIRLPLIINAQGLTDLSVMGSIKSESLPNITGSLYNAGTQYQDIGLDDGVGSGAIETVIDSYPRQAAGNVAGYDNKNLGWNFDASRSSSAYQDGAPVQQEAILYPYFIQVANEVDERLPAIREYKLNNPHFFGESKWSDVEPNNASWLLSNGAYHSGRTYAGYYEWLLKIHSGTETVNGVSVKSVDDEYTDYDFVVNTADETFRLPLLNGEESLQSNRYDVLTLQATGGKYTAPANGWFQFNGYATDPAGVVSLIHHNKKLKVQSTAGGNGNPYLRVFLPCDREDVVRAEHYNLDLSKGSGITDLLFIYATGNGSLYFYVGDTVQDANLINAGAVLKEIEDLKQNAGVNPSLSNLNEEGEAKLKSIIRLVTELPETPEEGVLYCIAEG